MRATSSSVNNTIWNGTIGRLLKQLLETWKSQTSFKVTKSNDDDGGLGDGVVFTKRYQKILKNVCLQIET